MDMEEYFDFLEEQFRDPTKFVAFEDVRPQKSFQMTIIHQRAAATMSEREQFMYKLFLLNNQNKSAEQVEESWAAVATSAIHGDGKGIIEFNYQTNRSAFEKKQISDACQRFYKPLAVDECFQFVQKSISLPRPLLLGVGLGGAYH